MYADTANHDFRVTMICYCEHTYMHMKSIKINRKSLKSIEINGISKETQLANRYRLDMYADTANQDFRVTMMG